MARCHASFPTIVSAGIVLGCGPGCATLSGDRDEMAAELAEIRAEVVAQRTVAARNAALADQLERTLAEVEQLLRRNQADLGLRMEEVEGTTRTLQGQADAAGFESVAVRQELVEVRRGVDARLVALEAKVDRVTNIPEGKDDLLAAAEKLFDDGRYGQSRRLYRLYESRYASDPALPKIRFRIGHAYFSERRYESSLGEFYRVVEESPDSPFVYDALYYSGIAYGKLGQCANATAYFRSLRDKLKLDGTKTPQRYDRLAAQQLEILRAGQSVDCLDTAAAARPSRR